MTTEERLAKVERELGRVKRRSRWLLAALGLGLGALALVWASAASVPKAEAQGAVVPAPQGPPRYQIAVAEGWGGPWLLDTYTADLYIFTGEPAPRWSKLLDGPPPSAADAAKVAQPRICPDCKGSGRLIVNRDPLLGIARSVVCERCKGTGKIAPSAADAAKVAQPRICPDCKGSGRLITPSGAKRCESCNGTGKIAP